MPTNTGSARGDSPSRRTGPETGAASTSPATRIARLHALEGQIVDCRECERLVAWRELVGAEKRAQYAGETYWARPIPGHGDPGARLLIVGLAPAAHGGNRTGRMFTGDRSGDFLFSALFRAGYANQPQSTHRGDGLVLDDAYVTAPVRCAPPDNRPTPSERRSCAHFLSDELIILNEVRVVLALGSFAFDAIWRDRALLGGAGGTRPRFAHGLEVAFQATDASRVPTRLVCSYHPSQRNVFTGLLTAAMFDAVLWRCRELVESSS